MSARTASYMNIPNAGSNGGLHGPHHQGMMTMHQLANPMGISPNGKHFAPQQQTTSDGTGRGMDALTKKRKLAPSTTANQNVSNGRLMPMSALRQAEKEKKAAEREEKRAKIKRTRQACTNCQHLKMRCSGPTSEDGACDRCKRSGKECMIQVRKPHRPWTKRKDLQIQQLTSRLEQMEDLLRQSKEREGEAEDTTEGDEEEEEVEQAMNRSTSPSRRNGAESVHLSDPLFLDASSSLVAAPFSGFVDHADETTPVYAQNAPSSISITFNDDDDTAYIRQRAASLPFVSTQKITAEEGLELFRVFMHSCALHTVILDPEWHTVKRVVDSSAFLFGVIVYIASTYHKSRRTLHNELEDEMDTMIGKTITSGKKSVEIVQGFLLLYQWNRPAPDPAEDRAWVLAGVAIRIATELRLHKPQSRPSAASGQMHDGKEAVGRTESDQERVNRERCWLMTFCVDRSLSMAVGRPWTISENAKLVRDASRWCENSYCRKWDLGISALCDLLKVASRQKDILKIALSRWDRTTTNKTTSDDDVDCESMMRIINGELEHWRREWYSRGFFTSPVEKREASMAQMTTGAGFVDPNGGDPGSMDNTPHASNASTGTVNTQLLDVHTRTSHYITKQASLRFNFAVLVTNTFGLQHCATRPNMQRTRTACTTRAIHAAQGIVKAARDGVSTTMTFSPQTQYTILGFGLITLIKLSVLVEESIAQRLLSTVQSGVAFLESVAIASDHTAARLASLVRAILRRNDERLGRVEKGEGSEKMGKRRVRISLTRNNSHNDGGLMSSGEEDEVNEEYDDEDGDDQDDDDARRNAKFAPGLEELKLPQRSSRAVTPDKGVDLTPNERHANGQLRGMEVFDAGSGVGESVGALHAEGLHPPSEFQASVPAAPPSTFSIPSDGVEVESLMQSLGFYGSIDASGWTQMTVDEILDNSFWMQLSDERSGGSI